MPNPTGMNGNNSGFPLRSCGSITASSSVWRLPPRGLSGPGSVSLTQGSAAAWCPSQTEPMAGAVVECEQVSVAKGICFVKSHTTGCPAVKHGRFHRGGGSKCWMCLEGSGALASSLMSNSLRMKTSPSQQHFPHLTLSVCPPPVQSLRKWKNYGSTFKLK